jgi:ABC-type antimicrobial peptide transport system permease subunit
MNKQLKYFLNKDLGFNKEAILLVPLPESNKDKLPLLKEKLLKYPEIEMVSFGTRSPLADWKVNNAINHPSIEKDNYYANLKTADEDYLDLYKLRIIAGQNFSSVKNSGDVVVNRKLTELIGFRNPHEAVGEHFEYGGNGTKFSIVGVVEDFHAQSLQKNMENVIFGNFSFVVNEMAIKINPSILKLNGNHEIVEKVQTEWDEVFPNDILNYKFFDEQIASFYQEEKNTSILIQLFAIIAILIGSLGLFGLISYTINQKTKEIGVRRVNGAQVSEILFLLNKDFMIYFAIAFLIACPIAYYVMANWLQNFAYKTELSWWLFALAGCITMVISLLTVSGQTISAARKNPVNALRYE